MSQTDLAYPMKLRSTRRDATSRRNGGTTSTAGQEHQQQMPNQMPHTTQSPETASAERTATAPTLPPGPHRPLTPRMPLPASPASSLNSSTPLFQEEGYSSTLEEESEVTFTHGRCNGTSPNQHAKRTSPLPEENNPVYITLARILSCYIPKYHQNSMPIPKVNNVHFFHKLHEFL